MLVKAPGVGPGFPPDRRLVTRRGNPVAPQTWDKVLQNPIYAGRIRLDKWGIDVEGDFDPLVDPVTFQQVQSVLAGKGVAAWSRKKHHPDFPLRRFVRCRACDQGLTGSWSKSKSGKKYAYYRCSDCGKTSVRQEKLHERFEDLLDRLKPKPELLRALRESVLATWEERKVEVTEVRAHLEARIGRLEERKKRLVEMFVYQQAIDNETYLKELDKIREKTTLAEMELHQTRLDGLDVETVLAFAEHVVVNARRLWNEYDPRRKRHLQRVLFPEGLAFDGESFGTPVTCLFFSDLEDFQGEKPRMVSLAGEFWNSFNSMRDMSLAA